MDEQERLTRGLSFRGSAAAYDMARPGYPARLVQQLIDQFGLGPTTQILEIGCATGQLTRSLVPTGSHITCLEPGPDLAQQAAQNFAAWPQVQVRNESFEQFDGPPGTFDLVVAATSLQWVDPAVRFHKSHQLLRSGGGLAILTNTHPMILHGFFEEVQLIYEAITPEIAYGGDRTPAENMSQMLADELKQSGLFQAIEMDSEAWSQRLSQDEYLLLLTTFSPHRGLPEARRQRLLAEIGRLIETRYDGYIDQPYATTLCLGYK
jgi:SAM-dependent methyltransferase